MTGWSFPQRPGPMTELDRAECRRLLGSVGVARIGYVTPAGPRIIPVNFALLPDAVCFRTLASGEIAQHALGELVAFEADDVDEFLRSGWSVLVTGELRELSAEAVGLLDLPQTPEPWAVGERDLFCSLGLAAVTGRRVLPG